MKKEINIEKKEVQPEIKKITLAVHDKEENSVIVNVQGWRMRVYFDKDFKAHVGNEIEVSYFGDLKDPHSIKFEKIK
ncbi:hypothetical protein AF332_11220 [Sporosarcina globispora]|uniref:Uncharacterized protein n=1 Tax=Sporosarcina globispora TaxID=1459 RepID=A0A0M0GBW9_SPOGL|nr:hypothetical protein [Sporosarcina globispora]KON87339.1 hypothetical protein AF332_11220 [Sporosarcina globispora]